MHYKLKLHLCTEKYVYIIQKSTENVDKLTIIWYFISKSKREVSTSGTLWNRI